MKAKREFRVGEESEGQRLDEFLAERVANLSRMHIAGLLARGSCAVNGAEARAGQRLRAGDAVELCDASEVVNSMTPERAPLEIVHEDEQIIVVVKPTGQLVHPTRGVKRGTLANALSYHLNRFWIDEGDALINQQSFIRPGLVHRLDRDTSGLLVVAKSQAALSRLSQHFQRRLVEKRYAAVVAGRVEREEFTIDAPIGRDEEARPRWLVADSGKHAETRLRVVERRGARTLVELEPVTGRTNQLRIHCAHAGHAIVGDGIYGGEPHTRLCLHASRLAFRHPATNVWTEFRAQAPKELLSAFSPES